MKFKVGDGVRMIGDGLYNRRQSMLWLLGPKLEGVVMHVFASGHTYEVSIGSYRLAIPERSLELITTKGGNMKDVVNNFLGLFLAEPEKTYRKLGIIDGDNLITDEGQKILLTYLLKEGGVSNKFFIEVAQPMLKEQEKEGK